MGIYYNLTQKDEKTIFLFNKNDEVNFSSRKESNNEINKCFNIILFALIKAILIKTMIHQI